MTRSDHSSFVYVVFIKATPDAIWKALTEPETVKRFWLGVRQEAELRAGSPWRLLFEDGRVADTGEVVEATPPRRLVLKWRNEFMPELKAEGYSRCTMEIEAVGDAAKLTVIHEIDVSGSKLIDAVSGGWPLILSNLKSLLETGAVVADKVAA